MRGSVVTGLPYLKIGLIIAIALALTIAGIFGLMAWEKHYGRFGEREVGDTVVEYNGVKYQLKENVETFLVLGLDKYDGEGSADSYNNDKQADFLMLFVIDNDTKQYTAIHINRDTIAEIDVLGVAGNKVSTVKSQIALAHTYGNGKEVSCHNTADSVSRLLRGMKVNHFASLTMDSVAVMNDLVGGVEIVVLDDFFGIDDSLVKGETVLLKGEQALHYVRTRKDLEDSSNSTRMQRQQQYLQAFYNAFARSAEADDSFIVNVSLEMSEYLVSDRSITQLQTLAEKFSSYEFKGIRDIEGESVLGEKYVEFYPNEDAVDALVIDLFYEPKK